MTLWTKSELLEALSGELLNNNLPDNLEIDEVVIDGKKKITNGLFIALKGENHDAHNFLDQTLENGSIAAIVDHEANHNPKLSTILVKNTFVALYKLAEFSRKRSKAKIIAITGSVGKTGTKEMLKLVFDTQGKTFATHGNLNNHFGLPLSLCNFSRDCEYGIFEMGMNHANEIEPLSKLARPHLTIITNVGPVHIEFFENEEGIALAKSEIFAGLDENGIALINRDNPHFEFLKKRAQLSKINHSNIIDFGEKNPSDYQIVNFKTSSPNNSIVEAKLKNGQKNYYEIATSQPAKIFNSIIAIACLDLFGTSFEKGLSAFKDLKTESGRGKVSDVQINGKNITIIDDSYNASVPSMHAGIEYAANLKNITGKKRIVAALGDMLELGEKSVELHEKVTNYLQEFHVDFAILVGANMANAAKKLPTDSNKTFLDSSAAGLAIEGFLQDGDLLYIKGSRGTKMEKIIENLTNQKSVH